MKLRHISSFKFKLFKPCKRILHLFKFRLRRPVCIRPLHSRRRHHHRKPKIKSKLQEGCISKMQSFLHSLREKRSEKTGRVAMLTRSSYSEHRAPHSSPLTPAYVRMGGSGPHRRDRAVVVIPDDDDDVEDACKSFEKYLIEMIGEDGKMRDLVDAEELLECWKNLNSPVYIDLVCRFYGELCKDLFSNTCDPY